MKSQYPCVVKDRLTNTYMPKGWWRHCGKPWVTDLEKAKVYRNSSGAKNSMGGYFESRYYRGPKRDIEVVEFHTEFWNEEMESRKK